MSILAKKVQTILESSSWIRRMFEEGTTLKGIHGEDAVCDFSLGNPDLPPPPEIKEGLLEIAQNVNRPFSLGYMNNAGHLHTRSILAERLSREQNIQVNADEILMTCGASGALNITLKSILDLGDEVLCPVPCFVEYGFYIANHGGVMKMVRTDADFNLDLQAIKEALTDQTRAIIINSPNNPTGQIYSDQTLRELAGILREHNSKHSRPVFILSDEPYRFLTYDDEIVPAILPLYPYALVLNSFSKSLSLPGERIGYLAISPLLEKADREELFAGLVLANRILGFVNAPVIGQLLLDYALNAEVDKSVYTSRRQAMFKVLSESGYEFVMPKGGFYFFPKAPGGDDVAFVKKLLAELVLGVPGSGFGRPGYFRLAFCVGEEVIRRALPGLKKAGAL